MDESKDFCWHRVIGSPMMRDFHTISKLTVLQMLIEKKAVLLSVCGMCATTTVHRTPGSYSHSNVMPENLLVQKSTVAISTPL